MFDDFLHSDESTSPITTSRTMKAWKRETHIVTKITCYGLDIYQTPLVAYSGVKQNHTIFKVLDRIAYKKNKHIGVRGLNYDCSDVDNVQGDPRPCFFLGRTKLGNLFAYRMVAISAC